MRIFTNTLKRHRSLQRQGEVVSGSSITPEPSLVGRTRSQVRTKGHRSLSKRRPSVITRRAVLSLLLALSLALITVSYRGGIVLHGSQLMVLEAVAPIERGLSRAWDPIAGSWNWAGRLFTAASENPKLERDNAQLRAQLRLAQVAQADLEKRVEEFAFDDRGSIPINYKKLWARVTQRQPGTIESTMVIDRGSNDGIEANYAVLSIGGLIGKVLATTPNSSVVALLTDDAESVSAAVVGSDAMGVLRTVSNEGVPTMQLSYVKQSADVEVGDTIITSGFASKNGELRSIYPRGIPVGVVTSAGNDPADLNKSVQVEPFANFDRIDRAMVLVPVERSASE